MTSSDLKRILIPWLLDQGGEVKEKGQEIMYERVLATRTVFFARRRVVLSVEIRPKEAQKELEVKVQLKETGLGLPSDTGMLTRMETYKTSTKRTGNISEKAQFLSQRYRFSFDYTAFSQGLEERAKSAGYTVRYVVS